MKITDQFANSSAPCPLPIPSPDDARRRHFAALLYAGQELLGNRLRRFSLFAALLLFVLCVPRLHRSQPSGGHYH